MALSMTSTGFQTRLAAALQSTAMISMVRPPVLQVHLDGGDAFGGTGDLEVHFAVEVLDTPECR